MVKTQNQKYEFFPPPGLDLQSPGIKSQCAINFVCRSHLVQDFWNHFENKLVRLIDEILLIVPFNNNATIKSLKTPTHTKHKINLRKRLLKCFILYYMIF